MAAGASDDRAHPGLGCHDTRCGRVPHYAIPPVCLRVLISSIAWPVADVVSRRVVVPPVYLPEPRNVKVHRDGRLLVWVTNPVNAPLVRQYGRDPVFPSPRDPPELLQMGVIGHRAVIEALVSHF
jgi:hypothetical protein